MARLGTYMGPKTQVQPDALERYEGKGWAAEEKHDGHWAEVTTDADGKITTIIGRSGSKFEGLNVSGLIGYPLGIPSSIFIAELEAGTEAANRINVKVGFKRLHVFDAVQVYGQNVRRLTYEKRRELIEIALKHNPPKVLLVRRVTKGFKKFFDEVTTSSGEGLVLKRLGRPYLPSGSDGKTDDWVRCKRFRFVDYVVTSIGKSEGGSPNLQVGLFINGTLQRVATIKNLPETLDYNALVGKVVECRGAEVHDSGALRHGHYERTREDKFPEECTLDAALQA